MKISENKSLLSLRVTKRTMSVFFVNSDLVKFLYIGLSKNVIDPKDQMTFEVLLANRWSLSPDVGAIQVP